jgi:hypothetical protein
MTMRRIGSHPLWIGHAGDARDHRPLFDAGIRALVDLAAEQAPLTPPRELIYCRFPIQDGSGNVPEVLYLTVNTVAALLSWGVPTLVCCGAGMSRSPAVGAAALALWLNEPADRCLAEVKGQGPGDVSPGLWQSLKKLFPSA